MESRSSHDLEEVRRRSDLVQIVSAHTSLRRSGSRLVGLCPFHEDKTPSFFVNPQKQLWHCFGCKAGGDVFNFVEKTENLTFIEAARWLAQKAGITLREASPEKRSQRNLLAEINRAAAGFFKGRLRSNDGAAARAYLTGRGISDDSIAAFDIGYAPAGWEQLFSFLRQQGSSASDIAASGLCLPKQKGPGYYDRFRSRIMFPVCNAEGAVIGFGGRVLPADESSDSPKYMNSPETPLFRKGQALYALDLARRAMQQAGSAIVVEGYFDCIACHQAGLKQTVATMGTALTSDQARLLRRHVERAKLAFDADSAGFAATLRSAAMFESAGLSAEVIVLPRGKDPDSFIHEDGADAFQRAADQAITIMECRLRLLEEEHGGKTDEARQPLLRESVRAIAELSEPIEQERWVHWLAERHAAHSKERAAVVEEAIWKQLHARPGARRAAREAAAAKPAQCDQIAARLQAEGQVLWALVSNDEIARTWLTRMRPHLFGDEANLQVFNALCGLVQAGLAVSVEAVRARCGQEGLQRVAELAVLESAGSESELGALVQRLEEWEGGQLVQRVADEVIRGGFADPWPPDIEELVETKRRLSKRIGEGSAGKLPK